MKFLEKYLLLLLLIANMTSEYILFASVSNALFYSVFALSVIVIPQLNLLSRETRRKFPELLALIVIYLVAQFVFQVGMWTQENILYTISKCMVFAILILCVNNNFDYYYRQSLHIFPYVILFLVALGWVVNRVNSMGSIAFGFVNRNVACTLATAGIAGFLFKSEKIKKIEFLSIAFLFASVLYGGSRNALAMCILMLMVRYGLSLKMILVGLIAAVAIFYVFPLLGIEVTAFDRLIGTINGRVEIDRESQREQALAMINAKPWTGWGYSYGAEAALITDMNAHNGYLTTIENLGWPCGLFLLGNIIFGSLKRLKLYKQHNRLINYHLAIVVSTLFGTNQEDYLIGVNQCTTNIFFLSFAVLGVCLYNQKYGRKNSKPQLFIK